LNKVIFIIYYTISLKKIKIKFITLANLSVKHPQEMYFNNELELDLIYINAFTYLYNYMYIYLNLYNNLCNNNSLLLDFRIFKL